MHTLQDVSGSVQQPPKGRRPNSEPKKVYAPARAAERVADVANDTIRKLEEILRLEPMRSGAVLPPFAALIIAHANPKLPPPTVLLVGDQGAIKGATIDADAATPRLRLPQHPGLVAALRETTSRARCCDAASPAPPAAAPDGSSGSSSSSSSNWVPQT